MFPYQLFSIILKFVQAEAIVFFFLKATKYMMMMIRTIPTNDPITAPVINPPLNASVKYNYVNNIKIYEFDS